MIDKVFLERSVSIRKEYLNLNGNLSKYESLVLDLKSKVEKTIDNLQGVIDNIEKSDIKEIQKQTVDYLTKLEEDTNKIQKFIDPINKKLEDLQKEEQALYNQIRIKHSDMSNDDILLEIREELKKRNIG